MTTDLPPTIAAAIKPFAPESAPQSHESPAASTAAQVSHESAGADPICAQDAPVIIKMAGLLNDDPLAADLLTMAYKLGRSHGRVEGTISAGDKIMAALA